MIPAYWLETRDRAKLLFAMMKALAAEHSRIAFEGSLSGTELFRLVGASHEETETLRRISAPDLDFVVLPLSPTHVAEIEKAIQSKIAFYEDQGIIHVQIEADGQLAFSAFDNFHRNCVAVSSKVPVRLLGDLRNSGILRRFFPA